MAVDMNEHPWMEHDITGHRAQLPDLPYWRAQGWNPVDGPLPEPDLLRDPVPEADAVKPTEQAESAVTASVSEGEHDG